MLNSATLSTIGDFASAIGGKNNAPGYVGESLMLQGRDDGVDVTISGTYTGATLRAYGRRPDGTESALGAAWSPTNNSTATTTYNFAAGTYGDVVVRLQGISSGSVLASLNSTRSGANAAPGAAAYKWPPAGPVS